MKTITSTGSIKASDIKAGTVCFKFDGVRRMTSLENGARTALISTLSDGGYRIGYVCQNSGSIGYISKLKTISQVKSALSRY